MYIKNGQVQYPCTDYNESPGIRVSFYGVNDIALPVAGEIILYDDDGFELAQQNAGNFARQIYKNNILTMTNEPEPALQPDPEPLSDPVADLSEMAVDHEYRITLMELGV